MSNSISESTFGERLYEAMDQAGLNNTQLASEVGVSDKTVGRYLNRDNPPSLDKKKTEKTIERIAEMLDVRFDWLLRGKKPIRSEVGNESVHSRQRPEIPESLHGVPEVEVSVGSDEKPHLDQVGDGFFASADYLQRLYGVRPERLCVMRVTGDSMENTLEPGQQIVLARWNGEDLRDGTIYCLYGPGGFMLRRLRFSQRKGKDMIEISSENDSTEDWWSGIEEFKKKYVLLARGLEVWQKL
jgi:phage repressor protein C with HTH and peptisase S24 domain